MIKMHPIMDGPPRIHILFVVQLTPDVSHNSVALSSAACALKNVTLKL